MNRNLVLFLLLICACPLLSTSFSFGEVVTPHDQTEFLQLILANKEYCTERITSEAILVKSEQIYPTNEGLFLRINQFELVRLPHVMSSADGCYVEIKMNE